MVGFGTTFRMSRRRGWESAYLDYATLKLLLTQIEAVYEENTPAGGSSDGFYYAGLSGFGPEDAFDHHDDQLMAFNSSRRRQRKERQGSVKGKQKVDWRDELFAESDSSAAFASSEYESDDDEDDDNDSDNEHHQPGHYPNLDNVNFNFSYHDNGVPSYGSAGSFGMGGGSVSASASGLISFESSGGSMDRQTGQGLAYAIRPNSRGKRDKEKRAKYVQGFDGGLGSTDQARHERRKRRKRHRSSNVPPHLRRAHEKARAITGRFLGLMRAEVDKISLFTHSQMGELAATIGSLRFPSDYMDYGNNHEHIVSHPSASSSSEDLSISSDEESNDRNEKISKPPLFQSARNRRNKTKVGLDFHQDLFMGGGALEDNEFLKSTSFRQMSQAEQIRLTRPTFRRSDEVLGEDFLLLSAVDEADAFTAVGVEFIHLLRYIFLNALAIRKLSKKHDYLLSSRMLGGYYHRLQKPKCDFDSIDNFEYFNTPKRGNKKRQSKMQSSDTPLPPHALDTQSKGRCMLQGVYDSKVQHLANSLVANTLSDSLSLAMTEFEVARRRADRLSSLPIRKSRAVSHESLTDLASLGADDLCNVFPTLGFKSKKPQEKFRRMGDDSVDEKSDAPSTSSSISLTRLRFVVASVSTLRNAAVEKHNIYKEFLARTLLAIDDCGRFVGFRVGLQGCDRETLDFFASYNPDLALILDAAILRESLANKDHGQPLECLLEDRYYQHVVSTPLAGRTDAPSTAASIISGGLSSHDTDKSTKSRNRMLRINMLSMIFSTVNYYIIFPSAAPFCCSMGWTYAHSALLIGSSNFTALASLLHHSFLLQNSPFFERALSFKTMLIMSSVFPFLGNIVYAKSYEYNSLAFAILGRLFVGLSSAEMVNKQLVTSIVSLKSNCTTEITKLKVAQICSILLGIVIGTIPVLFLEERDISILGAVFVVNFKTIPGYIMAVTWLCYLVSLIFIQFPEIDGFRLEPSSDKFAELSLSTSEHGYGYEKDYYLLPGFLARSMSESTSGEGLKNVPEESMHENSESTVVMSIPDKPSLSSQFSNFVSNVKRTKKLVFHNIALPTTFLVYGFVSLSSEVMFTSCLIITNRYFKWPIENAGYFLSFLATLILPSYLLISYLSVRVGERVVMKRTLILKCFGIVSLINYRALFILFKDTRDIFRQETPDRPLPAYYYDWNLGNFQYFFGVVVIFISAVCLEGLSLSLMSKISPDKLNRFPVNCSVMAPFISCLGRIFGDTAIVAVSFSHRVISTDIVNSICFILLCLCCCCYHVVKRHYFFLNGTA